MDDPTLFVDLAFPAFHLIPPGKEAELRLVLRSNRVPDEIMDDIIAFVPLAFGRVLLDGTGAQLSPDYATMDAAGTMRDAGRLVDHPVYAAAHRAATEIIARQELGEMVVSAALWSSEFRAVQEALAAGSDPADLVGAPPVITRPAAARPWWRFWR
ncbi:hypothetical protein [Longimicrobium terrae]|uniref:Uncharacterized protein n=1 Tax=Longimicrobium terrae TaxID=1639882 RepID=A0A841H5I1_9BACT|nr:hypothetical protein [Longimicrobium terrae]MBB4639245.1 hypothetical protein [Longimicrobium terrae]MBB6073485.1 hypothetical protein [Longimicrobium terrae]NNC32265.1 hypothetical protein [Longimicrobium terrae]